MKITGKAAIRVHASLPGRLNTEFVRVEEASGNDAWPATAPAIELKLVFAPHGGTGRRTTAPGEQKCYLCKENWFGFLATNVSMLKLFMQWMRMQKAMAQVLHFMILFSMKIWVYRYCYQSGGYF
jgi:hypothetical protein